MLYRNVKFGLFKHAFPDYYEAVSINDFIKSKHQINSPSPLKIFCPMAWFGGISVQVNFFDVDLNFLNDGRYELSDMTGSILVTPAEQFPFYTPQDARKCNLTEERYYKVAVTYTPHKDFIRLFYTEKLGPMKLDKSIQKNERDIVLAFQ